MLSISNANYHKFLIFSLIIILEQFISLGVGNISLCLKNAGMILKHGLTLVTCVAQSVCVRD